MRNDSYEIEYQEYEHQYQQGLKRFELNNFSNNQENERISIIESFLTHMNHRQNRLTQKIYDEKLPVYRRKLLHIRKCLKSRGKAQINISPTIILDLLHHPFTSTELAYLARG